LGRCETWNVVRDAQPFDTIPVDARRKERRGGQAMSGSAEMQSYFESEVESLEPFDFVAIGPAVRSFHMVEICRNENGRLEVRIPGRPPFIQPLSEAEQAALRERGFANENPESQALPWVVETDTAKAAIERAREVIHQVFEEKPEIHYDLIHGSHRAEHEAKQKLAEVRVHVERVINDLMETTPEQDADGDYLLALGDVQVVVAPRSVPGGPTLVRVFAMTNVGISVTPDLGLLLARLNFSLAFGRFALDADRKAILFDETLLGDPLNQDALRFAINVVSTTADEWDDRLKQMFGGATYQEVLKREGSTGEIPAKPGQGESPAPMHGLYL